MHDLTLLDFTSTTADGINVFTSYSVRLDKTGAFKS